MSQRAAPSDVLQSRCAACGVGITLDLSECVAVTPEGNRLAVTYVDPDIIVWDCPACLQANADAFGED